MSVSVTIQRPTNQQRCTVAMPWSLKQVSKVRPRAAVPAQTGPPRAAPPRPAPPEMRLAGRTGRLRPLSDTLTMMMISGRSVDEKLHTRTPSFLVMNFTSHEQALNLINLLNLALN